MALNYNLNKTSSILSVLTSLHHQLEIATLSNSESGKCQHPKFRNQGSIIPHCWKFDMALNYNLNKTHIILSVLTSLHHQLEIATLSNSESGKCQHPKFRNQGSIIPHCWKFDMALNYNLNKTSSILSVLTSLHHDLKLQLCPTQNPVNVNTQSSEITHCWKFDMALNYNLNKTSSILSVLTSLHHDLKLQLCPAQNPVNVNTQSSEIRVHLLLIAES